MRALQEPGMVRDSHEGFVAQRRLPTGDLGDVSLGLVHHRRARRGVDHLASYRDEPRRDEEQRADAA